MSVRCANFTMTNNGFPQQNKYTKKINQNKN